VTFYNTAVIDCLLDFENFGLGELLVVAYFSHARFLALKLFVFSRFAVDFDPGCGPWKEVVSQQIACHIFRQTEWHCLRLGA
jgi:hypothetical protein